MVDLGAFVDLALDFVPFDILGSSLGIPLGWLDKEGSSLGMSLGMSLGLLDKEGSSLGAALGTFTHWPAPSQTPSGVSGVEASGSTKQS